ncbi:hypothetical protein COY95_01525, partial [Candidatus Woesearchaeota archaeon CG_4_10_14_0_8_um_filter_47_5]
MNTAKNTTKYNSRAYARAVATYKSMLHNMLHKTEHRESLKKKNVLIVFDISNTKAYYSLAPLSQALHECGADLSAFGINQTSPTLDALRDVWQAYADMCHQRKTPAARALKKFIAIFHAKTTDRKTQQEFSRLFLFPDSILEATSDGFQGTWSLPYAAEWHTDYKPQLLKKTCTSIWKQVYNLRKNERVGISFVLIPPPRERDKPLEDYLDSFALARAMLVTAQKASARVTMSSHTVRLSMLASQERISGLAGTLLGCEYEKNIQEPIFRAFKSLSDALALHCLKPADATFYIASKGYAGKHLFGIVVGYPTLNRKSRWQTPGQLMSKFDWLAQARHEERK